jgi:1-deoxyxylulose-5-phosphate synthase
VQYRQLGFSDLKVSEISLGSWLTYGVGVQRDHAIACVHRAFEVGINFIDTANVYGRGAAESFLGDVLVGVDRASYVLATKAFFPMSEQDRGLSAAQIHKQLDLSLQRLRTDYVDLFQCHRYDSTVPLDETMRALTEAVEQGKARYVGFSEWTAEQIRAARATVNVVRFTSSQPQYSMLWRKPEIEVFPLCVAQEIGQIVWSPLAQGILTGKYRPGQAPPVDSRAASPEMNMFLRPALRSNNVLGAVERLKPIAARLDLTVSQLALAWVLRTPAVSAAIIGASRPDQVSENAGASGVKLPQDVLKEIDAVLAPAVREVEAAA